ncbi:5-oxoprolinase subunit C family protein [Phaeobacter marinintestinus]|uniref:5-oxoprolinase subunit C family protein n=1 Tax=Falsiphaeobacter marinintestinus TaxID=1492905 RepID=UPI0011B658F6|nr:biotin-dependent carboxyltransferase family protein [Phaeobacter marinintestinus]
MTGFLVHKIGPACTIQDQGRPGYLDKGLSRSGAADPLALAEGASLLKQAPALAALEMAGLGGVFEAESDIRIALTGTQMQVDLDGAILAWNASHQIKTGQRLTIGPARNGVYGYLHVGGGFDTPFTLGSRSFHLATRIGAPVESGDRLPVGPDKTSITGVCLDVSDRFSGGMVRVLRGLQTPLFPQPVQERFESTVFLRGQRANRMGVEMTSSGDGFVANGQLNILSEVIIPGDIQMTGDGKPYVLLPECQTTGGYPRIGTVLPCDMALIAQAPAGAEIRFRFVDMDEAIAAQKAFAATCAALSGNVRPLFRDVADISDLLTYQLVSGAISATGDMEDWG